MYENKAINGIFDNLFIWGLLAKRFGTVKREQIVDESIKFTFYGDGEMFEVMGAKSDPQSGNKWEGICIKCCER